MNTNSHRTTTNDMPSQHQHQNSNKNSTIRQDDDADQDSVHDTIDMKNNMNHHNHLVETSSSSSLVAATTTKSKTPMTTTTTSTINNNPTNVQCNDNDNANRIVIPEIIYNLPKEVRNILAGGIAGMVAKSVVAPLDRIKILYQVSAIPFHFRDLPKVVYNIIREEGIIALWKGNMATMIRVFPYSGIQFMTFDICKSYYLRKHHHDHHDYNTSSSTINNRTTSIPIIDPSLSATEHTTASSSSSTVPNNTTATTYNNINTNNKHDRKYGLSAIESLIAGMIAGTVSVICTYPLDLVRAQLAVLKHHHHHHHHHRNNHTNHRRNTTATTGTLQQQQQLPITNHGFIRVFRDNYNRAGVVGLFRGITPTLLGILPYSGIAFTINEQGKREIQHYTGRDVTTIERLQCGAFSGLIAQTVTYPIEVTRRRMQTIGLVNKNDTALSSSLGDNKGMSMTTTTTNTANTATSSISKSSTLPPPPPTLQVIITQLYNEQGIRGFLKGVSMNWMKGPVAFAISFTAFDHVQNLLERPNEN
jgi:Mitochondrial carrier protein